MILDSGKTLRIKSRSRFMFESVVILDSGKTVWFFCAGRSEFESVVILDSGKTFICHVIDPF